ncbi:ATP-binding cassette domain-containing protein, partial [Thauera linaloolentis]
MGIIDSKEIHALGAGAGAPPERGKGVHIGLRGLGKTYGEREVLAAIDLDIEAGEFVAIVGRSGCGKSTLLRLLAGLERASEGRIALDGQTLQDTHDELRIMFQDARLLPWKSVADNVALGLPGPSRERRAAALAALADVGLADRAGEWPSRLSGG